MGLFDTIAGKLPLPKSAGAIAAIGQAKKYLPPGMGALVNTGLGVGNKLINGDLKGAALSFLDSGLLANYFPRVDGLAALAAYWVTPTPLLGGITPAEAKAIFDACSATRYAKKNLFLIEVTDLMPSTMDSLVSKLTAGDGASMFNLFVTEVNYSPWTITGDKVRVGSGTIDSVNSLESVEMRITTLDDAVGTLKKWFESKAVAAARPDGTVGVPREYLVKIRVLHAFITDFSNRGGFESMLYMRPASIEYDLSRRDDNVQEIQMTFSQFDSFYPVI
ncbi:hypothetical protein ACVBEF_05915 [Glaciimonas sp. GG7]